MNAVTGTDTAGNRRGPQPVFLHSPFSGQGKAHGEDAMNGTEGQPIYELCFESLRDPCRSCAFPCDARGQVDMDRLGERLLCEYLYARTVIGREFRLPAVRRRERR